LFPIHKCGFLSKVKEIKLLRGGVAGYAAQATAPIDAEIGQKDQLWMETSYNIIFLMVDGSVPVTFNVLSDAGVRTRTSTVAPPGALL